MALGTRKNIAIGKNLNGVIFDNHFIADDKVLILKEVNLIHSGDLFTILIKSQVS